MADHKRFEQALPVEPVSPGSPASHQEIADNAKQIPAQEVGESKMVASYKMADNKQFEQALPVEPVSPGSPVSHKEIADNSNTDQTLPKMVEGSGLNLSPDNGRCPLKLAKEDVNGSSCDHIDGQDRQQSLPFLKGTNCTDIYELAEEWCSRADPPRPSLGHMLTTVCRIILDDGG